MKSHEKFVLQFPFDVKSFPSIMSKHEINRRSNAALRGAAAGRHLSGTAFNMTLSVSGARSSNPQLHDVPIESVLAKYTIFYQELKFRHAVLGNVNRLPYFDSLNGI